MRFFVAYLHNSVFPPLLSKEEETANLEKMASGDEQARNILIIHNLRLVAHVCKKFEICGVDKEDLISIGTIGLIKGVNTFSLDRKTRLATYAARCIENEILMYLRSVKNQKTEMSIYDPVGVDKEGNEVCLLDMLSNGEPTAQEKIELDEERRLVAKNLHVLDDKESYVLSMRYGLGGRSRLPQREIAKTLGISRSYVSRIEKKAINKLAKAIGK